MNIFITGSEGFVGTHLKQKNYFIINLGNS